MILFKNYKFISFDNYYSVDKYNQIIAAAIQNGIKFRQFLSIQPPYNWFLMIKPEDLPKFLIYDEADTNEYKWLVSIIRPTRPNEAYYLERRHGQEIAYWQYVTPAPFKKLSKYNYMLVFITYDNYILRDVSKELGKSKIWQLPKKAELKGYYINVCFNPYIKSYISKKNILFEYDNNNKTKQNVPKTWAEVEYNINHFKLVQEKIIDKTWDLPYYENGVYFPLKKTKFLY